MNILKRNVFTLCGLFLWALLLAVAGLVHTDLFDSLMRPLHNLHILTHRYEVPGLIFLAILLIAGKSADILVLRSRAQRDARIKAEKFKTLCDTVRAIEDSVLNTYNGCQLLIFEAEEKGASEEVLGLIKSNMQASIKKIRSLVKNVEHEGVKETYGYEYIISDT